MNKKGFIDFDMDLDMETILAIALGVVCGFIALFVSKGSGAGFIWKLGTFVVSMVVGFYISRFILNK